MSQGGATLLEALIGGAFLALALVGIALLFSEGHSFLVGEGDDRVAIGLVREKIEAVRSLGFGCIPVGGPGTIGVPLGALPGCPEADTQAARTYNEGPLGRYTSRTTVVVCADPQTLAPPVLCPSPPTGKKITVEIVPRMAKARSIRVETLVAAH